MNKPMLVIVGLLVILGIGIALSSGSGRVNPSDCVAVSRSTLDAIEEGLIHEGSALGYGFAMQAGDWWYVVSRISGPGEGNVGAWAVPDPANPGPIYAVDGFARNFSQWGTAGDIETMEQTLRLSRSDALRARECIEA